MGDCREQPSNIIGIITVRISCDRLITIISVPNILQPCLNKYLQVTSHLLTFSINPPIRICPCPNPASDHITHPFQSSQYLISNRHIPGIVHIPQAPRRQIHLSIQASFHNFLVRHNPLMMLCSFSERLSYFILLLFFFIDTFSIGLGF